MSNLKDTYSIYEQTFLRVMFSFSYNNRLYFFNREVFYLYTNFIGATVRFICELNSPNGENHNVH